MSQQPYSPPATSSQDSGPGFRDKLLKSLRGSRLLPMTVSIAALLSLGICLAVASTLLGNAGPLAVVFGLSASNLTMTSLAAIILFVPTIVTSLITYALSSVDKRWLSLIPAVVIPLLGGFGFFVFIGLGLG